jgi:hypothetical protein
MGRITFAFLGSLGLAILLSHIRNLLAIPRDNDILWLLDHKPRRKDPPFLHTAINIISFYVLGVFLVPLASSILISSEEMYLSSTCFLLTLIMLIVTYFLFGKLKTINIIAGFNADKILIFPLVIWLMVLPNTFEIIYLLDPSSFQSIKATLIFHTFETLVLLLFLATYAIQSNCAINNLKRMSESVEKFIFNSFTYSKTLGLGRDIAQQVYNPLNPNNRMGVKSIVKDSMLTEIVKIMRNDAKCEEFFNNSSLNNFLYYGIYSKIPICALMCIERLNHVILNTVLFRNRRQTIALLQGLLESKNQAILAFSCIQHGGATYKAKAQFLNIIYGDDKVSVRLRILQYLGTKPTQASLIEEITLSEDNIIWVGI